MAYGKSAILEKDDVIIEIYPEISDCKIPFCSAFAIIHNNQEKPINIDFKSLEIDTKEAIYKNNFLIDSSLKEVSVYNFDKKSFDREIKPVSEIKDTSSLEKYNIQNKEKKEIIINAYYAASGMYKYSFSIDIDGQNYFIDPFFNATSSFPQVKFFSPFGVNINASQVEIIAGAVATSGIKDFRFQIRTPAEVSTNYTATTKGNLYNITRDKESDGIAETSFFGWLIGDIYTIRNNSYINNEFMLRNVTTGYADGFSLRVNSTSGTPQSLNFIYDVGICEAMSGKYNTPLVNYECANPITIIANNINISSYFNTAGGIKYIPFDAPFYVSSLKNYSISFLYVSGGDLTDNSSDIYTIQYDSNPSDIGGSTLYNLNFFNSTGAIIYNASIQILGEVYLWSNMTYYLNYTPVLYGTYNITAFALDNLLQLNVTENDYFTVCSPDWECDSYYPCTIEGKKCKAFNDLNNCGINFTGDSELYTEECEYTSVINVTNFDMESVIYVILFIVFLFVALFFDIKIFLLIDFLLGIMIAFTFTEAIELRIIMMLSSLFILILYISKVIEQ
jgi:hypothetical protein